MTIRISLDEGTTWINPTIIHRGPAAYSDLVKIDDQRIGILFEAGQPLYDQILFATLDYLDFAPSLPAN